MVAGGVEDDVVDLGIAGGQVRRQFCAFRRPDDSQRPGGQLLPGVNPSECLIEEVERDLKSTLLAVLAKEVQGYGVVAACSKRGPGNLPHCPQNRRR